MSKRRRELKEGLKAILAVVVVMIALMLLVWHRHDVWNECLEDYSFGLCWEILSYD